MKKLCFYIIPAFMAACLTFACVTQGKAESPQKSIDQPTKAEQAQKKDRIPILSPEDIEKAQNMSAEERKAFFKEKRAAFKNMSPEERAAVKEKRKAWYQSLTPEQKENLKERRAELRKKMQAEREERLKNMPPEQREALEAKKKKRMEKQG